VLRIACACRAAATPRTICLALPAALPCLPPHETLRIIRACLAFIMPRRAALRIAAYQTENSVIVAAATAAAAWRKMA
jgi:hypothetical protein